MQLFLINLHYNFQFKQFSMNQEVLNFNLQLAHALGSTCSFKYQDAIAICDEDTDEPKILFPAGKTIARKHIERSQMDFIKFQNTAQAIECIHILPTHTHVATSQKMMGSNIRVIRIYSMKGNEKPQTIKIFHEKDGYGYIKSIVFSYSEPQFMCCLIGDPHNKLIYIDVSKNKPLAESNFTVKDIEKITISPRNSHLICASGGNTVRLFKVEEYTFKPLEQIRKLPKGRKFLTHGWYKGKIVLAVTNFCEVLVIQEVKSGIYEVKQQYTNVFNETNYEKILITAICPFSKGFILGSNNGKFCLWIRKQQGMNYQQQKLQLVRKWATTEQRASNVTGIAINSKEDLLAISLGNNDITTIFLNELMPQVTDLTDERENKDIFFQYLYKGFHNNPVTGMDLCLQRPLLATCSHEDSTIRIWNYKSYGCKLLRMFYFRLKESQNKPLITLSFHPCGYYLAVGCKDKLRFFYVLNNELRPYREIAIKGAHIVKFSEGGQYVATASPVRQESSEQIIHIFNAITLEQIKSFSVHNKKIRTLEWKNHDQYLCSISEHGTLFQWKVNDWKQSKKIFKHEYKYECSKYFHAENVIMVFATAFNKYFIHKYNCDDSKMEEIQIDMRIVTMSQISINKKSCIVAGLDNGTILTLTFVNKKLQATSSRNDHLKAVTGLCVSPCNKFLISTGADCMIFIYQSTLLLNGVKQQEDNGNSSVDDFLADVVLYPKKEIIKYDQKEKEYTKIIGNLERKLQSISDESEKKHKQKIQQLQIQKNRVIEDFKYRIQRIQQQIQTIRNKNLEALSDLDSKNFAEAADLQKKYEQKIDFEKEKYFQLEQELIQQKIMQKNRLEELQKQKVKQVQKIKSEFKNKFQESQKIYTKSKEIVNNTTELFQQKIKHIESQQEEQLKELQQRLQHFRTEKASLEEQLKQKEYKVKKQHLYQVTERNDKKRINEDLHFNKKKIDKEVEEAKQKLKEMKLEHEQKIEILNNKHVKIGEFQKKMNDLQKKKHILSYKATQMKKALEPKETQIEKLKLDLVKLKKQFDSSRQRNEKFVLYTEKIEKQRQFLEKQVNGCQEQVAKSSNHLDQIIYDIYNSIQNNKDDQDSKAYSRSILKLYHKYVQKISQKQDSQNQKGVQQMTKQIVHLQKSLFQMNQSNKKSVTRKHDEISKRINENAELINNLNDLKKQNLELTRNIKSKNNQVENLRAAKCEALIDIKKDDVSVVPYQDEEISTSNFNVQNERKKLTLLDMNPRQKNASMLTQYKKKQCELVSEIEFLNQRIHKADFFMKEIKDCIKKHYTIYKCQGERINLQNDLSNIA